VQLRQNQAGSNKTIIYLFARRCIRNRAFFVAICRLRDESEQYVAKYRVLFRPFFRGGQNV
jgi:hypothetical protein